LPTSAALESKGQALGDRTGNLSTTPGLDWEAEVGYEKVGPSQAKKEDGEQEEG
jgi:hypothetical protein